MKKRARRNIKDPPRQPPLGPFLGVLDDDDAELSKPTGTSGTTSTRTHEYNNKASTEGVKKASTEGWTLLSKTQLFWKRQRQRETTSITGQQKSGESRGRPPKPIAAPDTGHRRARTPPASNRTRIISTRTSPSSFWDEYTPDQQIAKYRWNTITKPCPWPDRMDFRERTDLDNKDIIITEHWGG